jgi:uncharacterized protein YbcC (UPF0753/DUF2309 family)
MTSAGPAAELRANQAGSAEDIDCLLRRAAARIAPSWPLDRFIAVNPLWEMVDEPLPALAARLSTLSGARLLMPRAWFLEQWRSGRLRTEHLEMAIARSGASTSVAELRALMESEEPVPVRRARVMDVADLQRDLSRTMSWRDYVTHSSSQFCAAFFDEGQAKLGPTREGGLYASWRRQATGDRGPALLMGLKTYTGIARGLPATGRELAARALTELSIPIAEREAYLFGLLLDLNGWASWCAYRRWVARLGGKDEDPVVDLLAVRLAWEWILHRAGGAALALSWRKAMDAWRAIDLSPGAARDNDWLLQSAMEIAWQEPLCEGLRSGLARRRSRPLADVQAVFCIDVRSEIFRRALEAQDPNVQTLGFAGFFGMPIAYQPVGAATARPQLPGLLAARMRATDVGIPGGVGARRAARLDAAAAWTRFKTGALSSFAFVEAMGLTAAGSLLGDSLGRRVGQSHPARAGLSPSEHAARKPRLAEDLVGQPLGPPERAALAASVLRAMSLTRRFARLVALVGHGSAADNNPHAAGLDCGACGGQTGEVNARVAAALLNDPRVRSDLAGRGIDLPASTHFVAGLHNTTTDEVTLFDLDEVPRSHRGDLGRLESWLSGAGVRARKERAVHLGLGALDPASLHRAVIARAADWAQVRPEWGLANNAGFIVAPRERCQHLDLGGRVFLHDYRYEEDPDFGLLELIMTAPMLVAHWINLQYYASTVDNPRYGSGNKLLHNVVGGHLGVFEGNGGDLRIGLPQQSLHDGVRWVHTPLRLSVFIEAPCPAIEAVMRKHRKVRELVENGWLHLFQLDGGAGAVRAYRAGQWKGDSR